MSAFSEEKKKSVICTCFLTDIPPPSCSRSLRQWQAPGESPWQSLNPPPFYPIYSEYRPRHNDWLVRPNRNEIYDYTNASDKPGTTTDCSAVKFCVMNVIKWTESIRKELEHVKRIIAFCAYWCAENWLSWLHKVHWEEQGCIGLMRLESSQVLCYEYY